MWLLKQSILCKKIQLKPYTILKPGRERYRQTNIVLSPMYIIPEYNANSLIHRQLRLDLSAIFNKFSSFMQDRQYKAIMFCSYYKHR